MQCFEYPFVLLFTIGLLFLLGLGVILPSLLLYLLYRPGVCILYPYNHTAVCTTYIPCHKLQPLKTSNYHIVCSSRTETRPSSRCSDSWTQNQKTLPVVWCLGRLATCPLCCCQSLHIRHNKECCTGEHTQLETVTIFLFFMAYSYLFCSVMFKSLSICGICFLCLVG